MSRQIKHRITKRRDSSYSWNWILIAASIVAASVAHQYLFLTDYYSDDIPCDIVMAKSSFENSGWGIFTLKNYEKGETLPLASPFLIFTNLRQGNLKHAGLDHILHSYIWNAGSVDGQFEAQTAYAFGPGVGVLANSHYDKKFINVHPHQINNREALGSNNGASRHASPVAGSATSYQNIGFQAGKALSAGNELIINYGSGWKEKMRRVSQKVSQPKYIGRSVEWLAKNGRCLDLIEPVKVGELGYGVKVKRPMREGQRLTSIPLLPLHRSALSMPEAPFKQLAINYMFGQSGSDLLLLPYGPIFSLINHSNQSNAKIEWDEISDPWTRMSVDDVLHHRPTAGSLLANLVATRDLLAGEEVYIDYGPAWQQSWEHHVAKFAPSVENHIYPSEFNNDPSNSILKDLAEQEKSPYPAHLMSVCVMDPNWPLLSKQVKGHKLETRVAWDLVKTSVLMPCTVSERISLGKEILYNVRLEELDRSPQGNLVHGSHLAENEQRVVTKMPRRAIFFVHRPYESDQHLPKGFRHEMQSLSYPAHWYDTE